jgi:hypothetical protein
MRGPSARRTAITPASRSATRLVDRAAAASRSQPGDHLVAQLRRELGRLEPGPGRLQRRPEVVEHVRHPALAAGQVEGQHRPLHRPAQARAVGDRQVDLLDRRLPLGDHVQRLAPQRLLQPVGDEAGHLAVHRDHRLAGGGEELRGPRDGGRVGLLAADHLHQRDQVRRVERMAHHRALRAGALHLHVGHRVARRRRRDHHVDGRHLVDLGQQPALELEVLGGALLHEVGLRDGLREVRLVAEPVA